MLKENILSAKLLKNQIAVFYLGQEGFLLKHKDIHVLTDPYLTDYVDQNCCTKEVLWRRKYEPPMAAPDLDFIDYVLCTHAHYDHADPDTLSVLHRVNPNVRFIVPFVLRRKLISYGISEDKILCIDGDETLNFEGLSVTAVPAAHEQLHMDKEGHYEELGYKIQLEDTTVYHAGDCCVYDGLSERIQGVDIGLLPINGRDYYRLKQDIIGNMDSREAVLLAKETGMKLLVPMHFDLYDVNEVNPAHFIDWILKENPNQRFHIFKAGEGYIFGM